MSKRRKFLRKLLSITLTSPLVINASAMSAFVKSKGHKINTVTGEINASQLGKCLIHEHLLVDFIGAKKTGYHRWERKKVVEKVLPYLVELKEAGFKTLFDCTPAFLGRDPQLLKELSLKSGIHIITNTGLYGAVDNKYLPDYAFEESAEQIAKRWKGEYHKGIEETGIKPGFIKISVNPESLSVLHKKLVQAAGRTHKETGLTIASHTGPYLPAKEQVDLLEKMEVPTNAFIWVHAQNEKDLSKHIEMAKRGAWVSLEGIRAGNYTDFIPKIFNMKEHECLNRLLVSQDAGWYNPDEPEMTGFASFSVIAKKLIPALRNEGFTKKEIKQIFEINPLEAFAY